MTYEELWAFLLHVGWKDDTLDVFQLLQEVLGVWAELQKRSECLNEGCL
jgi:hypothetical protein